MSWSLHRWVWLLEAPLFVGAPPAGALNRCRPYVLARGMWGALTSESAQAGASGFPDYREWGKKFREHARFTYLYPAARVKGAWRAWLPEYCRGTGLVWHREDHATTANGRVPDRQFRRGLVDTRPGTAINPDSDSAVDGSLREAECVMTHWRMGSPGAGDRVAFAGYAFVRNDSTNDLDHVTTLFLGGDTRYGLGRVRRIEFAKADAVFGAHTQLDGDEPIVTSPRLLSHGVSIRDLYGAREVLAGWDRTANSSLVNIADLCWVPGSYFREGVRWRIDQNGIWHDSP